MTLVHKRYDNSPPQNPPPPPQTPGNRAQQPGAAKEKGGEGKGKERKESAFLGDAEASRFLVFLILREGLPHESTRLWKYFGSRFKQAVCQLIGRRRELRRPSSDLVLDLRTIPHKHLMPDGLWSLTA
jgi:hypothetical protein